MRPEWLAPSLCWRLDTRTRAGLWQPWRRLHSSSWVRAPLEFLGRIDLTCQNVEGALLDALQRLHVPAVDDRLVDRGPVRLIRALCLRLDRHGIGQGDL